MNYYSHNIGDYAQATMHLSLVEDGIYSRILRRYYAEEAPIKDDLNLICRWVGARTEEERVAVPAVLDEFFVLRDGYWHNKRADEEIAAYQHKAETNRVNGKGGGRPPKKPKETQSVSGGLPEQTQPEPTENPVVTLTKNQEPITNNQDKEIPPTPRKRGNGFDASKIELPDWLPREDWETWVKDRRDRKKPITEEGARQQLKQLANLLAEGHRPEAVIANSVAGGYQGLFPPSAPGSRTMQGTQSNAQRRSAWNDELNRELAETLRPREIDMGVIDATH